jgi:pimeloyl-ACP methyl ester carboxylesterase
MASAATDSRFVEVDGLRVHVRSAGSGRPVVLIMGGGVPGVGSWPGVEEVLIEHAQVITYDRAGTGLSDPPRSEPTAGDMAAELRGVLDALGVMEPAVVVGASLGAFVALLLVARSSERVGGLLLLDPPGLHPPVQERKRRRITHIAQTIAASGVLRTRPGRAALVNWLGRSLGSPIDPQRDRDMVDRFARAGGWRQLRLETARRVETCTETREALLSKALRDLPLVVVTAGRRPAVPGVERLEASHAEIAAASSRGRQVRAESASHWVSRDDPGLVVRLVGELVGQPG